MTKMKDLRGQTKEELMTRVDKIEIELFQLKGKLAVDHRIEKPHKIKELRKEKARILTLLTQS